MFLDLRFAIMKYNQTAMNWDLRDAFRWKSLCLFFFDKINGFLQLKAKIAVTLERLKVET